MKSERSRAVRVEVVFHVFDQDQGRAAAEQMIDRAHQIANLPECECDLDVSVIWDPPTPPTPPTPPDEIPPAGVPPETPPAAA